MCEGTTKFNKNARGEYQRYNSLTTVRGDPYKKHREAQITLSGTRDSFGKTTLAF